MTSLSFRHKPLDHAVQSIRLVHLAQELSSDGLVQCTMWHTTTAARYVCLSYRWGECNPSHQNVILMNGKRFSVQQNLLDFLTTMQSTAEDEDAIFDPEIGYWIDALCIDQQKISERNHQVAQMGSIYSKADLVHVWLGKTQDLGRIRPLLDGPSQGASLGEWSSQVRQDMDFIDRCIFRNQYWTRAWVIQEIVLAQRVEVSLDTERFAFTQLTHRIRNFCLNWAGTHFAHFAFDSQGSEQFRNQSLLKLLDHFLEKECSVGHDRVFSLLALCSSGEDVPVSYELSRDELAYHVLKAEGGGLCVCSARIVARNLGLDKHDPSSYFNSTECFLSIELVDFELRPSLPDQRKLRLHHSFGTWPSSLGKRLEPYDAVWRGCVDHWLHHFYQSLERSLQPWSITTKLTGGYKCSLSKVVRNSDFFVHTNLVTLQDGTRWRELSGSVRISAATHHENLCIVRVPIHDLFQTCSITPRLCSGGVDAMPRALKAAVPRIYVEVQK